MLVNRSKRFWNSVNEIRVFFSSKSKAPNHYETLKVSQSSTQDDIKSAYYELSKKYHPDVNKSVDAKQNFQDVSDAYEVLGNYNKRKLYDRDLLARGTGMRKVQTYTDVKEDPLAGFYKSRKMQKEYNPDREASVNQVKFDFDQWTRAHYGSTFKRSLRDKSGKKMREELKKQYEFQKEKNKASVKTILITTFFIICFLSFQSFKTRHDYDRNLINNRKQ